jgi:hypothetical protein
MNRHTSACIDVLSAPEGREILGPEQGCSVSPQANPVRPTV